MNVTISAKPCEQFLALSFAHPIDFYTLKFCCSNCWSFPPAQQSCLSIKTTMALQCELKIRIRNSMVECIFEN